LTFDICLKIILRRNRNKDIFLKVIVLDSYFSEGVDLYANVYYT
jgi:hypothetical protein